MTYTIAVPFFPGSNGDRDAIAMVERFGMKPDPVYFHIGDDERLAESAKRLVGADGAAMPGGFPYQDRLGFGKVPSKISAFADAMRELVDSGKPVIAFCSGNQIAHAMGLAFPEGSPYGVDMKPNIYDKDGEIKWHGFLDRKVHTKLVCDPRRTAFTGHLEEGEVVRNVHSNGGGRFTADQATLRYLVDNGLIVTRYSDSHGNIDDNFPTNPNGSILNIEAITNQKGNLHIGMLHNERVLRALEVGRANLAFESMREYLDAGSPDLSEYALPAGIPIALKDFSYLSPNMDRGNIVDVYVEMLTDDNERITAELFMDGEVDMERRRILRLELNREVTPDVAKQVLLELAKMDLYAGIMLKKDLPTVVSPDGSMARYEIVDADTHTRDFVDQDALVLGYDARHESVDLPNPEGYRLAEQLGRHPWFSQHLKSAVVGSTWFFKDEGDKERTLERLLG